LPEYEKFFYGWRRFADGMQRQKWLLRNIPDYGRYLSALVSSKNWNQKDVPELNILVLNYAEMDQVFALSMCPMNQIQMIHLILKQKDQHVSIQWMGDWQQSSGVLASVSRRRSPCRFTLPKDIEAIKQFANDPSIRLWISFSVMGDVLMAQASKSSLTKEERRQKVVDFAKYPAPEYVIKIFL
jgi:hypothetical protein